MLHKVLEIRNLTATAYVLRIERKKISFKAGQCFNLGLKNSGVNREYSIYSGENDSCLEFLVKEIKEGIVSSSLRQVTLGEEINLHGPYGSFVIDPVQIKQVKFYFICTGTGIAPFHSFIRSHPILDYQIINGIRFLKERYDYDEYHPLKITTCISREKWAGFHGRLTTYLPEIPIDTKSIFYICGNQKMIQEAYVILRKKKVSGNYIFTEAFF